MKFEDIDKKMERWHNRIYPWITNVLIFCILILCISSVYLMSVHFSELAESWNSYQTENNTWLTWEMYNIIFYISALVSPIFLIYTRIFTKFHFPAHDSSSGRKPKKPLLPFGR